MKEIIHSFLKESIATKERLLADEAQVELIARAGQEIKKCAHAGGTLYVCGNGGSACDAMHFTEELVARYKRDRKGYRAMHFMDASTLTCWSNDYDYQGAFARQAETFCQPGDVFVGISTSGNSDNVIMAARAAKAKGAYTIALAGKGGGKIVSEVDTAIVVPSKETDRIQESHITLIHMFCEFIET